MPGCAGWQDPSSGSVIRGCPQWDLLRPGLTGAWLLWRFWGRGLRVGGQDGRSQDSPGVSLSESVSSDHQLLETGLVGLGQGEPVGFCCLPPLLGRTQMCWQLLPQARREAREQRKDFCLRHWLARV